MRLECFNQGAQDYILKPFAAGELVARVKVHLNIKTSHDILHARNDALELRARARQDMTDMIVHDMKTPLSSIMGTLSLIGAQGLISGERQENLINAAGSAANFLLLMVNDLLDVDKAAEAGLKPVIAPFDVPAMFGKLTELFSTRCRTTGVGLQFRADAAARLFASDQNLVYRIAANLIANAMKASCKPAAVEVETKLAGGRLRLIVMDRGSGVADAEKQRIFDKYAVGAGETKTLSSGTGLGLTFCRVATQSMMGRIWVEDRDGGGSRFIVELPFVPVSAEKSAR